MAGEGAPSSKPATVVERPPATLSRDDVVADAQPFTEDDDGRYALVAELARGGGGRIAIAVDRKLGRRVALKRALDRDGDERLAREAEVLARLEHPAIVPIHDTGVDAEGSPFYTMKLLGGRDLAGRLAEARTFEARLALLPVVATVADAMAYAHGRQVIHRDLKPGNVLVGEFGEVAVIDWGLGKVEGASEPEGAALTRHGAIVGTPAYMAPEQARGEPVDASADVYAVGAMLYHVLTGELPYGDLDGDATIERLLAGPPPDAMVREPRIPRDLAAIVGKAMARDVAARYPTARELAEDLRRYQTGRLVAAHRYPLRARLWRWVRRHRVALALGAAVVAFGAAGAAFALRGGAEPVCEDLDADLDAAWGPAARAAGERAFTATSLPYAASTWATVATRLDAQRAAISTMRVEACRATRVQGAQTEPVLALRMQCLDRRTSELAALAETFAQADATVVGKAQRALGSLGRVLDCADSQRLQDAEPLPADPTARTEVLAILRELDRMAALDLAGKTDAWTAQAAPTLARAKAAGWGSAHARALVRSAAVAIAAGKIDDAAGALEQATAIADRSRDDATRARALVQLARLELTRRERLDRAAQLLELAGAAADRTGDPEIRASVYVYRSWLATRREDPAAAVAAAETAAALAAKFEGNELLDTDRVLAGAYVGAGKLAEAEAAYTRALTRLRAAYGDADHAEVARALEGLAQVAYARAAYDRALELERQAIAIFERIGANPDDTIAAREYVAVVEVAAGRPAKAAAELAALLPACDARLGRTHSECIHIADNIAAARSQADDRAGAVDAARVALARYTELDPVAPATAKARSDLGIALRAAGNLAEAVAEERRALAMLPDGDGARATEIRVELARALVAAGSVRDGIAELKRAIAVVERHGDPTTLAALRAELADAEKAR